MNMMLVRREALAAGCALALAAAAAGQRADVAPAVVIDGDLGEWRAIEPALVDPADAPQAPVDIGTIRTAADGRSLALMIEVGRSVNLQQLAAPLRVHVDVDGNPATGATSGALIGADLLVECSPPNARRPDQPGMGVTARAAAGGDDRAFGAYDVGWIAAPTVAAEAFEVRLDRGGTLPGMPPLLAGASCTVLFEALAPGGASADVAGPLRIALPPLGGERAADGGEGDPLGRPGAPGTLRAIAWNVERGNIVKEPDAFQAILRALQPDVILLQELRAADQPAVQAMLRDTLPGEPAWTVMLGEGGGDLRCAVAARGELIVPPALRTTAPRGQPERTVRIAAATLSHQGRPLLAISAHLTCCGAAGDWRDQRRVEEARAIRAALATVMSSAEAPAGLIIAGDLNLVGSAEPLEMLLDDGDIDGSDLSAASAMRLDGRSNATWGREGESFGPGRLDFAIYSDAVLELRRSFTLDSSDLPPRWRNEHQFQADETARASDHRPVVIDVGWE